MVKKKYYGAIDKEPVEEISRHKQRLRLRMLHKRLRVNLVFWDDLDVEDQMLLQKYYGYNEDGMQL